MNFATIRGNVLNNLNDAGGVFDSAAEVNAYILDAYTDIISESRCIIKTVVLAWQPNVNYYSFLTGNGTNPPVTDYLATIAILNQVSNLWLRDDISLRDFDRLRRDWEVWAGTAQFWASHSYARIAICPKPTTNLSGSFTLFYWAQSPATFADSDTPLISNDMQTLLEWYPTAECIETAGEPSKAATWWAQYFSKLQEYKERTSKLNASDLLLRV